MEDEACGVLQAAVASRQLSALCFEADRMEVLMGCSGHPGCCSPSCLAGFVKPQLCQHHRAALGAVPGNAELQGKAFPQKTRSYTRHIKQTGAAETPWPCQQPAGE